MDNLHQLGRFNPSKIHARANWFTSYLFPWLCLMHIFFLITKKTMNEIASKWSATKDWAVQPNWWVFALTSWKTLTKQAALLLQINIHAWSIVALSLREIKYSKIVCPQSKSCIQTQKVKLPFFLKQTKVKLSFKKRASASARLTWKFTSKSLN